MSSIASVAVLTGTVTQGQLPREVSLQDKTVVLSNQQQVIEADAGYDGLGEVTVPAVALENKTVTPTSSQQTVTAGEGYDGLGTVTVEAGSDNLPAVMFGTNTTPTIASPDASHKTFKGMRDINSITLTDATSIGEYTFKGCSNLVTVSAPEVTSVGMEAFYSCTNLASVSLPKCVTVAGNAFNNAFDSSEDISLTLPECLTVSQGAFHGAHLKTLILPKAVNIDSEILQDSSVETITLSVVTTLGEGALRWANNLTTVNIPECVTLGDGALQGCGFSSINLPKVQTMGREQFNDNGYLRDVYLGYNGVVAVNKGGYNDYNMFGWDLQGETVTIHVPSATLASYQSDATWTAIVAEAAQNNITVVFAGDYSAE